MNHRSFAAAFFQLRYMSAHSTNNTNTNNHNININNTNHKQKNNNKREDIKD